MQFPEDQDQALIPDALVALVEGGACLELLQHVVHLREGEARMLRLPLLAEGVEFFSDHADVSFEPLGRIGKGERVETVGLRVARTILQSATLGRVQVVWIFDDTIPKCHASLVAMHTRMLSGSMSAGRNWKVLCFAVSTVATYRARFASAGRSSCRGFPKSHQRRA
jgi:hypothetical protein